MLMPADNRFGLPPFYQLRAWFWRTNPNVWIATGFSPVAIDMRGVPLVLS